MDRPNIIHIMTDDHSFQTISAYGHPISRIAQTPNLDRLASEGMLFTKETIYQLSTAIHLSVTLGAQGTAISCPDKREYLFHGSGITNCARFSVARIQTFRKAGYSSTARQTLHLLPIPNGTTIFAQQATCQRVSSRQHHIVPSERVCQCSGMPIIISTQ